uniref:Uncharacterized protein n=1 Tax=Oryza meridionalis TaxID=40149 RepID=A0A0E0DGC4_9ORYZ
MGDATIPRPPPKLQPAILRRSAPGSLSHSLLLASHPSWLRALGQIEAVAADGGNPQRKGRRSGTPVEGGSTLERSCGGKRFYNENSVGTESNKDQARIERGRTLGGPFGAPPQAPADSSSKGPTEPSCL